MSLGKFIKNFKLITFLILSAGLMFLYPVSILTMDHSVMSSVMHHASLTGHSLIDQSPMSDSQNCVNFHLNILQKLCEFTPQVSLSIITNMFIILALALLLFISNKQVDINCIVRHQYQRLKIISLTSFLKQLGRWLIIIEKKSPAYAFTSA